MTTNNTDNYPTYIGLDFQIDFSAEKYKYVFTAIMDMMENFKLDGFDFNPVNITDFDFLNPTTDEGNREVNFIEFTLSRNDEKKIKMVWNSLLSEKERLCFCDVDKTLQTREMKIIREVVLRRKASSNPHPSVDTVIDEKMKKPKNNKKKNNKKKGKRRK